MCLEGAMRVITFTATVMLLATPVWANEKVEYGEYLSGSCVTCHQLSGADNGIPQLLAGIRKLLLKFFYTTKLKSVKTRRCKQSPAPLPKRKWRLWQLILRPSMQRNNECRNINCQNSFQKEFIK